MPLFPRRNPSCHNRRRRSAGTRTLFVEKLETRRLLTAVPYGAAPSDTGEFLLGSVLVTPVFLESNGVLDTSTEDWTSPQIAETKAKIVDAMDWWVQTLANQTSVHHLEFIYDFQYADTPVETKFEPISQTSNTYELYVDEFLVQAGFATSGSSTNDILPFNDAQRRNFDTNWAFTIFVVNSQNDADGMFAAGGTFDQAFAFAGGRFMVVPSTRPVRTFTHELDHMFWGNDEYSGGGTNLYLRERGYYNTQNLNAKDNPAPGFVQQDSIMAAGTAYFNAFNNHTSAPSTLAMIGWQDTDGDGVFDVLDIPHTLDVSASYNATTGAIRVLGQAEVGRLRNLNSEGNQSDITINRIDTLQYRLDGGNWMNIDNYGTYMAVLDISMTVATGANTMEIRTISVDSGTGVLVTSSEPLSVPAGVPVVAVESGIAGNIFNDVDSDGQRDNNEIPLIGRTVQLFDNQGIPVIGQRIVEPDDFPNGTTLDESIVSGVTLSASGFLAFDDAVIANLSTTNPTGGLVFVYSGAGRLNTEWQEFRAEFVAEFDGLVGRVSVDAIASSDGEIARLEAFDGSGNTLGRFTTPAMTAGQTVTMELSDPTVQIATVRAYGRNGHDVHLDRLVWGTPSATTTDVLGNYAFSYLPVGDYTVKTSINATITTPVSAEHLVSLSANAQVTSRDFGAVFAAPWQNPNNQQDVNADQLVTTTDLVNLVGDIFLHGQRQLDPPTDQSGPPLFGDITGEGRVSVADVSAILQYLFLRSTNGGGGGGGGEPLSVASVTRTPPFSRTVEIPAPTPGAGEPYFTATVDTVPSIDSPRRDWTPVADLPHSEALMLDVALWDQELVDVIARFASTRSPITDVHRIEMIDAVSDTRVIVQTGQNKPKEIALPDAPLDLAFLMEEELLDLIVDRQTSDDDHASEALESEQTDPAMDGPLAP